MVKKKKESEFKIKMSNCKNVPLTKWEILTNISLQHEVVLKELNILESELLERMLDLVDAKKEFFKKQTDDLPKSETAFFNENLNQRFKTLEKLRTVRFEKIAITKIIDQCKIDLKNLTPEK